MGGAGGRTGTAGRAYGSMKDGCAARTDRPGMRGGKGESVMRTQRVAARRGGRGVPHAGLAIAAVGMLLAALASAAPAHAQGSGHGFLFGEPRGSIALRAGFAHANAGSDVFSLTTRQLTLGRGDFSGFTIATD